MTEPLPLWGKSKDLPKITGSALSEALREAYAEDLEELQELCEELKETLSTDRQELFTAQQQSQITRLFDIILDEEELTGLRAQTLFLKGALVQAALGGRTERAFARAVIAQFQRLCEPFEFSFDLEDEE